MTHHLKIVASNFQLNEKELTEFALQNKSRYGIEESGDFVTTSTSFTKMLVDDFKKKNEIKEHDLVKTTVEKNFDDVIYLKIQMVV